MSPEVEAAIIGGGLSGLVVFSALALERALSRRTAERQRRQIAVSDALRVYLTAMAENVRARGQGDIATQHKSGAMLLGATGQLAVLGPKGVVDAVIAFDRTGRHMGTRDSQDTLLALLQAIRSEVLPGHAPLPTESLRDVMFEAPAAPAA